MSHKLISRSGDLTRLRNEGYDIEIRANLLLVKNVPYVDESKVIKLGTLVSTLKLANDKTQVPDDHTVRFIGTHPCREDGTKLIEIVNSSGDQDLGDGLVVNYSFSRKPTVGRAEYPAGYRDYHEKMTTYVGLLITHALPIDSTVTAQTFPVVRADADESVFCYLDTASSRAQIGAVSEKLALGKVAIVGLGGTGSYVLDLVAKTPVKAIYLFDGDRLYQHNAFRSPGAPSGDELDGAPSKVRYFSDLYSKMRRNIIGVEAFIDKSNADRLKDMDFVFLCLDRGNDKKEIVEKLKEFGIPFIDVGMGIQLAQATNNLGGILRVTTSTPTKRDHVESRIPFSNGGVDNEYASNIQIADLNALNAALAVVKWKKLLDFYSDFGNEHFSAYTIDGNHLLNEEKA